MALPIRLVVQFTPFPPGFQGDLSKFCRAFVDRIEVLSPFNGLTWQIGGIKPTSNVGPWLNDLGQPFVWNETLKDYVPMDLSLSLAGIEADVAAAQAAIASFTALVGSYSTTAQMNAAIATAVGGSVVTAYPANATVTNQTMLVDGSLHLMLTQKNIDPNNVFDNASSTYTAPVAGYYRVSAYAQVDDVSSTPSGMEVGIEIDRNGIYAVASGTSVGTPPGLRWYPRVDGLLGLNAGDLVVGMMSAQDGVNSGSVMISNFVFSIELVQKQ